MIAVIKYYFYGKTAYLGNLFHSQDYDKSIMVSVWKLFNLEYFIKTYGVVDF